MEIVKKYQELTQSPGYKKYIELKNRNHDNVSIKFLLVLLVCVYLLLLYLSILVFPKESDGSLDYSYFFITTHLFPVLPFISIWISAYMYFFLKDLAERFGIKEPFHVKLKRLNPDYSYTN